MSNESKFLWNEDDIVVVRRVIDEEQSAETVEALLDPSSEPDAE